jgi:hypothetical protein
LAIPDRRNSEEKSIMTAVSDETGRDAYLPFDAPLWQQYEHRIKWLMARIGMPDSVSLAEAMKQLLNDAEYIRTNRTPAAALSAAPVTQEPVADELLRTLREHHNWHLQAGTIGLQDGDGGWIEIDNGAEYSDSALYERTAKLLEGAPPEQLQPMPRGGMNTWWWEQAVLLRRKVRALEKAAQATSAGLGADEIAQIIDDAINKYGSLMFIQEHGWSGFCAKVREHVLALLSRAGVQSNSTQKDGSR